MARGILNEIKWRDDMDLEKTEIWYVHRGAENDTKIVSGSDIVDIQRSFLELSDATIPFHRIYKILYNGNAIFEREPRQ